MQGDLIYVIDFYENNGEGMMHYIDILKRKGYLYGKHFMPHDVLNRDYFDAERRVDKASEFGMNIVCINDHLVELSKAQKRGRFEITIGKAREIVPKCVFASNRLGGGMEHIEKYSKKWSPGLQVFTGELGDEHSHAGSAFRYLAIGVDILYADYAGKRVEDNAIREYENYLMRKPLYNG